MMLTVKEVAEHLRVSATCVYQLIEKGKLVCHRIGLGRGAIRVRETDLAAFIDGCKESRGESEQITYRPGKKLKHLKQ